MHTRNAVILIALACCGGCQLGSAAYSELVISGRVDAVQERLEGFALPELPVKRPSVRNHYQGPRAIVTATETVLTNTHAIESWFRARSTCAQASYLSHAEAHVPGGPFVEVEIPHDSPDRDDLYRKAAERLDAVRDYHRRRFDPSGEGRGPWTLWVEADVPAEHLTPLFAAIDSPFNIMILTQGRPGESELRFRPCRTGGLSGGCHPTRLQLSRDTARITNPHGQSKTLSYEELGKAAIPGSACGLVAVEMHPDAALTWTEVLARLGLEPNKSLLGSVPDNYCWVDPT